MRCAELVCGAVRAAKRDGNIKLAARHREHVRGVVHDLIEGYDIPGEIVDGMNFREVRDKIAEVVDSIRKEPHPAFLEARTYRYRGHSMSDPASYRTKDELEKYRLDDPITRLRAQLTREGKLTNEQFDGLDKQAKETVLAAVKFAEQSPQPPLEKLYDYTYADGAKP